MGVSTHVFPPMFNSDTAVLQMCEHSETTKTPMKMKHLAGLLTAILLTIASTSLQAQLTNRMIYNFDTDQVTGIWGNWFGGDFGSVAWDSAIDSSNNPSSGSLKLTVNAGSGFPQFVMFDGFGPSYNGL